MLNIQQIKNIQTAEKLFLQLQIKIINQEVFGLYQVE